MRWKNRRPLALALSVATLCFATQAVGAIMEAGAAKPRVFSGNEFLARQGDAVLIGSYAKYDEGCVSLGDPVISIYDNPVNGSVSFRHETITISNSRRQPACNGKALPSISVWYTPNSGFTGIDEFSYQVDDGFEINAQTAVIRISGSQSSGDIVSAAPRHVVVRPLFAAAPTANQFFQYFPQAAQRAHITGKVRLICIVTNSGTLSDCQTLGEDPLGWGFGAAAIRLSKMIALKPLTADGVSVVGNDYFMKLNFDLAH